MGIAQMSSDANRKFSQEIAINDSTKAPVRLSAYERFTTHFYNAGVPSASVGNLRHIEKFIVGSGGIGRR